MRTINLVTLFDKAYAPQALALYQSLERTTSNFMLHMLAIGHENYEVFYRMHDRGIMPGAKIYNLSSLSHHGEVREIHRKRFGTPYYFFTMTPFFTKEVYDGLYPNVQTGYIDADCYFFSSARKAFDEAQLADVGVVPHRFPPHDHDRLIPNGKYNVSLVIFGPSTIAGRTLERWTDQVLEKCDASTVGDQKYLDEWDGIDGLNLHQFSAPIGVAPWNIGSYKLELDQDGKPTIDGQPIVFYHFHEFRPLKEGYRLTGYPLRQEDRNLIYKPYINAVQKAKTEIAFYEESLR